MTDALLTASKPELLDKEGDRTLRGLLYDYFAFGRSLGHLLADFPAGVGVFSRHEKQKCLPGRLSDLPIKPLAIRISICTSLNNPPNEMSNP